MVIYPAIDVLGGKCVRLTQGRYDMVDIFSEDPVEVALGFKKAGASFIHMVDLDGARKGEPVNRDVFLKAAAETGLPVQVGGGIRSMDTIDYYLSQGIRRVILGTVAAREPGLVREAVEKYGPSIAVGIDAKDGKVAIQGWERESRFTALGLARMMEALGVSHIIYTDISRDGMLSGPNLKAMEDMAASVSIEVIASGGVRDLEDIIALSRTGVAGVIVGKALYTGNIDIKEAINYFSGQDARGGKGC